jgi:hypothetical protein
MPDLSREAHTREGFLVSRKDVIRSIPGCRDARCNETLFLLGAQIVSNTLVYTQT